MIRHYFKIAIRNLGRQKGLTFINIFGLSIGVACFSLFMLYALNELNYDRFHINKDHIYKVYRSMEAKPGEFRNSAYLPIPLGPAMKQDFADVKDFVRFKNPWQGSFVRINGKVSSVPVSFADPGLFSVFSFPFVQGGADALKDPHAVVMTETVARKLFQQTNPIGKRLEIKTGDNFDSFIVSAVCRDIPSNSSITFDLLCNFNYYATSFAANLINDWHSSGYQTYVQLRDGSSLPQHKQQLITFYKKYHPDENPNSYYGLQSLLSVHTDTGVADFNVTNPKNVWILLSVAFAILLIACINFTTLAIGRSAGRAKEIGVRKVIGGTKRSLVIQFITESIVLSIMSCLLGLLMAKSLLPLFNRLSEKELDFSFHQFPELSWLLLLLTFLVGILSGSYPALVLSSFKPAEILRRKLKVKGSNFFTRSLVTLQFVLSVGLIISTIIILRQLHFMRSKHPGFEKENVLMINAADANVKKVYPLFRQELLACAGITGVAGSEMGIGEDMGWSQTSWESEGKQRNVYEYFIDPAYLSVMSIPLLAGRNFDPGISSDTVSSVIINESMMRNFGWTLENAIGQPLKDYSKELTPVVIGVVKDFHFRPFREKIEPQLFHQFSNHAPYVFFVKLQPGAPAAAIASMESCWKKLVPEIPLRYSFLNEDLDRFYKTEARWGVIIGWAGGISVFLSCLGLLGLAVLASVNRIKEIGIRKILGASVAGIVQLLSGDFMKLIALAIVLASPLAWYVMQQWLQDFAYRIGISWWHFAAGGLAAIIIALVTISFQTIQAATANPVKNLRTE